VSQMIRCQNCGAFVPAEKAFCPNCSEPMEMEEKSNRSHSFSSDMMSTIRDDPEKYRELLREMAAKKKQQQTPQQAPPAQGYTPQPPPPVRNAEQPVAPAQPVAGYNQWQAPPPVPPTNSKRNLILGISVVVLVAIVVALLFVFKVI
jgi:hypothetical protein